MSKKLPKEFIPDFNELYSKTMEFIREHQGEKGYINTQDDSCDTIYAIVFDEGQEMAVEMEVAGVKVEENEIYVRCVPILRTYHITLTDEDFKRDNEGDGGYDEWMSLMWSDVYWAHTLIDIAESIHEYVLD
jgi:hypothetical protein